MKKNVVTLILGLAILSLASCTALRLQDSPTSTGEPSSMMTKLHFPKPWFDPTRPAELIDQIPLTFIQQMEVRRVPNSSANELLFAALPNGDNDYRHEVDTRLPKPQYSLNAFAVKFSSPLEVRSVTTEEWESGSRLSTKPRFAFSRGKDETSGEIEYRHKRYAKTGKYWGGGRVSPSGKWLAVFSYSGIRKPDLLFGGTGSASSGDVFWQVYDAVTGKKVFEWEAKNVKSPASLDDPVVWLEDQYFLFPEDEQAQNFVVVSLPPVTPEENPVSITFPSRRDSSGQPIPAPSIDEAWTPLAPLTKEQAASAIAPTETEIAEVRLSENPLEFMFAITEETENRNENRQRPDGGADYNYKLFSTYYYAVSIDNPSQTRMAGKEEWARARVVKTYRPDESTSEAKDTVAGPVPPGRQFPKTGKLWGSPRALSIGEWLAVFSYDQIARAGESQNLFVDLYNQRTGDKFLSSTVSVNGSPNDLFKRAQSMQGSYMILPLNSAFTSFALWRLPE